MSNSLHELIEKEARNVCGQIFALWTSRISLSERERRTQEALIEPMRRVADAAVKGERERCLKLVNDFTGYSRNEAAQKKDADIAAIWNGQADSFEKAAAAIRKGTPE